ncbi:energy transducer TonB [Solimicrobium silvestre]|uniref:TonB family C-terminal domain n=1 Tax=Solimicrobium silvestre TaxID=2099400 RepID=A0A2S9H5U9_9BURK|nr:energy transducer TonB [Solimicrobium silvestre]PRC95256.1 TonB family C-terminal domain [Solimicrobium silvestre]
MKTRLSNIAALAATLYVCVAAFGAEVAPVLDSKSCDPPKYPKAALMNEETGTVSLLFLVAADGKVVDSKVEKSSGSKSLDKAALTAFSQCKFKPGTKDGKPDQLWAKVEFVWKLD